jgi:hypothetical protein
MRLLIIPDVHGRDNFSNILDEDIKNIDQVIFLGDYWDSFDLNYEQQLITFQKIVAYKQQHPDKVICEIGNHDIQYMRKYNPSLNAICTGHQQENSGKIASLFDNYGHLFQMAYGITKDDNYYLFTHAGVTNELYQYLLSISDYPDLDISFLINKVWMDVFKEPKSDSYLWIRPTALRKDSLQFNHQKKLKVIQFVGHSPLDNMLIDLKNNIYFTDLDNSKPIFLTI